MKKFAHITASLSLLVVTYAVVLVTSTRPATVATQSQPQQDERKEKLRRLKIEDFHGEAATLRAKQLRKLNKGVARAMKDAEKRRRSNTAE